MLPSFKTTYRLCQLFRKIFPPRFCKNPFFSFDFVSSAFLVSAFAFRSTEDRFSSFFAFDTVDVVLFDDDDEDDGDFFLFSPESIETTTTPVLTTRFLPDSCLRSVDSLKQSGMAARNSIAFFV